MRRSSIGAALLISAAALGSAAQSKPDFSGHWVIDGERVGGFGNEITVTQNAKTLTVTRTQGSQTVRTVYNLDGSDSKNTVQGRGGASEQVSKSVWDGARLIVTTQFNAGPVTVQVKRVFAMEGANLTIETTQPGVGRPGSATKLVYKKR